MKNFLRKHGSVISLAMALASILFAMIVSSILIAAIGISPIEAFTHFGKGVWGNAYNFGDTVNKFTPMICTALCFAISRNSGFMNVGSEGQVAIGCTASLVVAQMMEGMPMIIAILLPILAGILAGALLSAICGVMKILFGTNELLTTLMFNYIVSLFIQWLVHNPLKNPAGQMEQSAPIPDTAKLPIVLPGSRLHMGVFIALLALILIWFLQQRTIKGFEMRLSGTNGVCARYVGVNEKTTLLLVILIAGALSGLGGALELQGNQYKLMSGISNGFGFDGINIAVMGRFTPVGIFLSSILYAAIRTGCNSMERGCNVPSPMSNIIQGVLVISVMVSTYFAERIRRSLVERREG